MPDNHDERWVLQRGRSEPGWRRAAVEPGTAGTAAEAFPQDVSAPKRTPAVPWWRRLFSATVLAMTLILTVLAILTSVKGFRADGVSMHPTLNDGDHMIINGFAYAQVDFGLLDWAPFLDPSARWDTPERGDIIVFHSAVTDSDLVKRVIGRPGDEVVVDGGLVYINREPLDESYAAGPTECSGECSWRVPDGQYFVLGDNRGESRDSREGWTVPIESIAGRKLLTY